MPYLSDLDVPTPRVSVVMPVYNADQHLGPAIDSILNQTLHDLELVIVDDGSDKDTVERLEAFSRRDPRVRVYRQNHGGIVAALNRGAALARAAYLARMDADDIAFPNRLEKQVSFLDSRPEVALVGGGTERISSNPQGSEAKPIPTSAGDIAAALFAGHNCFIHPTVVMRTSAFTAVGGYRAGFEGAEDYDLWLRLAERFELANLPDTVLGKRIHPGQVSLRSMEQCIIGVLAARACSESRRTTGIDPIGATGKITRTTLQRLGVSNHLVEDQLIQAHRRNFRVFREAGNPEGALQLFRETHVPWRIRRALRSDYALALLRQMRHDYASGRWLQASQRLLRACVVHPSILLRKLVEMIAGQHRPARPVAPPHE